jgi:putative ABC transport system permease protein
MRQMLRRVWHFIGRRQFERDLAEELDFHRQMAQEELGSVRAVGNATLARDEARDVWTWPWLQDGVQDARFACRLLLKDRRFTLAATFALALGIGANTAAFTFLRAVYQSPPYENASQLVTIRTEDPRQRGQSADQRAMNLAPLGVSYQDFLDWRRSTKSFSHLVIASEQPMNIADEGMIPERYLGSYTSSNIFRMLGRAPMLGRDFTAEDEQPGAPPVVVIAHTVWKARYGSDSNVVGRLIRVNDVPSTIVGVMPEGFVFPFADEIWQPIGANPNAAKAPREVRTPIVFAFGRVMDGVTLEQAQSELDSLMQSLAQQFPATNNNIGARLEPLQELLTGPVLQQMAKLLMAAVLLVLLIACVNVANLLLTRTSKRAREIAIRASLGATRRRIVRQLLIESLVLAALAGILGIAIGQYAVRLFVASFSPELQGAPPPYWLTMNMDAQVYVFLAAICAATTVLFGLAPALRVSRTDVNSTLKEGGRGTVSAQSHRWAGTLIVVQLSVTLMLLAGTAIMGRQFLALYRAGQVIDTSGVVTMRLALSVQKYRTPEQRKMFYKQLEEGLAANVSFSRATVASDIPFMTNTGARRLLTIDGAQWPAGNPQPTVAYVYVGPRYFETLGIKLLRGRLLAEDDGRKGMEGAVVNERFASMFFSGRDPLGHRIRLVNAAAAQTTQTNAPWFTIVGVSQTIPWALFQEEADPVVYVPVSGEPAPHRFASVIARSRTDTAAAFAQIRQEVRRVDPDLPGYFVQTLDGVLATSRFPQRLFGAIFLMLASIALILSTVGLFALTANRVAERTQEIGVRLALGARAREVVWLFVRSAIVLLAIGLTIGLAGSMFMGRYLPVLFGRAREVDALTLGSVGALLVMVGLAASIFPARRAARVDPLVALRYD